MNQLERKLTEHGVEFDSQYYEELAEWEQAAVDAVPPPPSPDDNMPPAFKKAVDYIRAFGHLATLMQVVIISAVLSPLGLLALMIADWYRLTQAYRMFQPSGISVLLALVTVAFYVYLSLAKAQLEYLLQDDKAEYRSLRRTAQRLLYFIGIGKWQPIEKTKTRATYERVSFMHFIFLLSIAIILIAEFALPLIHAYQRQDSMVDIAVHGVVGLVATMTLLLALEIAVSRNYDAYMVRNGAEESLWSADYLKASQEDYLRTCELARKKARRDYQQAMLTRLENQQAQIVPTYPPMPVPSGNGSYPVHSNE